jgi:hypothetical protein
VIYDLLKELRPGYAQERAYQVLERFFDDHFQLEEQTVSPKRNQELSADSLQSVDDLEATFRRKGSLEFRDAKLNAKLRSQKFWTLTTDAVNQNCDYGLAMACFCPVLPFLITG